VDTGDDGALPIDLDPCPETRAPRQRDLPEFGEMPAGDSTTPVIESRLQLVLGETIGEDLGGVGGQLLGDHQIRFQEVDR